MHNNNAPVVNVHSFRY